MKVAGCETAVKHGAASVGSVLPRPLRTLLNATLPDGSLVDVRLDGPIVAAVAPASGDAPGPDDLDLRGFVLLPAPADAHAHVDKSRTWEVAKAPHGDLPQAVAAYHAFSHSETEADIAARARATLLEMLQWGTTAVRTHVNLRHGDDPLRGVRALLRVREELSELMDIELVSLPDDTTSDAVIEDAFSAGVDLIGGAPHLAPSPSDELERLIAIAERIGAGIDLHTDEALTGEPTIAAFARRVRDWDRNVSAGHCVRLGTLAHDDLGPIIGDIVESDIGIIALPITNLYLQGWDHPVSTPRGLTALRPLIDAGVRLGAGADNVRDPFNPLGRCDALETVALLVTAGHLTIDEAYALASDGSRAVMRLPVAGAFPGGAAEFLAIRGGSLDEVVATAHPERRTIHRGALVASTEFRAHVAEIRSEVRA